SPEVPQRRADYVSSNRRYSVLRSRHPTKGQFSSPTGLDPFTHLNTAPIATSNEGWVWPLEGRRPWAGFPRRRQRTRAELPITEWSHIGRFAVEDTRYAADTPPPHLRAGRFRLGRAD